MIHIGILAALPVFPAVIGISRLPLASDIWQPCCGVTQQVRLPLLSIRIQQAEVRHFLPDDGLPVIPRCLDVARQDGFLGGGGKLE